MVFFSTEGHIGVFNILFIAFFPNEGRIESFNVLFMANLFNENQIDLFNIPFITVFLNIEDYLLMKNGNNQRNILGLRFWNKKLGKFIKND